MAASSVLVRLPSRISIASISSLSALRFKACWENAGTFGSAAGEHDAANLYQHCKVWPAGLRMPGKAGPAMLC